MTYNCHCQDLTTSTLENGLESGILLVVRLPSGPPIPKRSFLKVETGCFGDYFSNLTWSCAVPPTGIEQITLVALHRTG